MNKSLIIALLVLAGVGAAVITTTRSREAKTTIEKPSASLPAVKKDELTELAIERPGQPAIVLQKQGDKWSVSAPLSAEAGQAAVDAALEKLGDLTVTGVAATRKENHERLEVDAAHAIRVKAKAGDKPVLDLHVGASKSSGTMVRVEGQEQVLAVRGSIRYAFDKDLKDFRKREITDLEVAEITGLSLSSSKGNFKFERPATEGAVWAQASGEKPIAKFDPAQVETRASTAAHLRAADYAAPGDTDAVTGLSTPSAKVVVTKKDGSTIEISLGKPIASGDEFYTSISGSDVVYRLARFSADRLMPDAKFFEKSEAPPPAPQAMPSGMPMGGPDGQQLPPEIMQQLQQQMRAQGGHP